MQETNVEAAYDLLHTGGASSEAICAAIVQLGKPLNEEQIHRVSSVVAQYLHHENFLVRNRSIWFLGCWGKLPGYLNAVIDAAKSDDELDNRAFAARCAGQILKKVKAKAAIESLFEMVNDPAEVPDVRLAAYSALLYAYKGDKARAEASDFEPMGDKQLGDFDLSWLASLPKWAEGLPDRAA